MTASRGGALARAAEHFDSGAFMADLARRVAIPTESQEPDQRPELYRYLTEELGPSLDHQEYHWRVFDNPDPRGGPFLVAERI